MYHERLMFKFIGNHVGVDLLPRQIPHKLPGSNFCPFWSSELKVGTRFNFIGFWYEVEVNSLVQHDKFEEYNFCARRIN